MAESNPSHACPPRVETHFAVTGGRQNERQEAPAHATEVDLLPLGGHEATPTALRQPETKKLTEHLMPFTFPGLYDQLATTVKCQTLTLQQFLAMYR